MRNLQSLRLLLADKDKEIEHLKKELTEEKNAYIKMYNMYAEKDNIINEAIKYIKDSSIWFKENPECDYILHLLKGSDKE